MAKKRILIIDDEQPIRKMFRIIIERAGFEVFEADGCSNGMSILREVDGISVILLDVIMPGVTGIDCLSKIREEFGNIPVIMVTGVTNVDTTKEVMEKGAFDHIVKPVKKNDLLDVIGKALGSTKY